MFGRFLALIHRKLKEVITPDVYDEEKVCTLSHWMWEQQFTTENSFVSAIEKKRCVTVSLNFASARHSLAG